jgi:ELWxxDGT repeat protein
MRSVDKRDITPVYNVEPTGLGWYDHDFPILCFDSGPPGTPLAAGGFAYFLEALPSSTPIQGRVWRSDGTAAGTAPLTDFLPGIGSPWLLLRNRYLLIGSWALDLTSGEVAELFQLSGWGLESVFHALPSLGLAVVAERGGLWVTNGTPAGTAQVFANAELPGSLGSTAAVVGNRVIFSGNDGVHGEDLWVLDFSPGGSQAIVEIPAMGLVGALLLAALLAALAVRILGR